MLKEIDNVNIRFIQSAKTNKAKQEENKSEKKGN